MGKKGKPGFNYVTMFTLDDTILLVSVRTTTTVNNALRKKKGMKRVKLTTPV